MRLLEPGYQKRYTIKDEVLSPSQFSTDIALVSSDAFFFGALKEQAATKGLDVQTEINPHRALLSIKKKDFSPKILLVSQTFVNSSIKGLELIQLFKEYHPKADTLLGIIFDKNDLNERYSMMESGIELFVDKEMSPYKIIEVCHLELSGKELSHFNILLYENDLELGQCVSKGLQEMGMECSIVNRYEKLNKTIKEKTPNLVVLDLSQGSALKGIKRLQSFIEKHNGYFPVVVCVDSEQEILLEEAYSLGMEDFIIRPVSLRVFIARLANIAQKAALKSVVKDYDPLTGILSRTAFIEQFQFKKGTILRNKMAACLALIDLDFFKEVNDEYGHDQGDHVLKEFAHFIAHFLRKYDLIGRWGGEEFVILLEECALEEASNLMNLCLKECRKKRFLEIAPDYALTFSCGIVPFPSVGLNLDELLYSADTLLYQAKRKGRNCVMTKVDMQGVYKK